MSSSYDPEHFSPPTAVDTGNLDNDRVTFPAWRSPADTPAPSPQAPRSPIERLGVLVVGLGRLALEEILPALIQCGHARLVGLASGTPDKLTLVATQYGIAAEHRYDYADFDRIMDDEAIDAVFIALPNAMHRSFADRAARAGKHVLCEKPMAMGEDEARDMTAACEAAGVRLMVAYRMHYEPHHRRLRALVTERRFGRLIAMTLTNVQTVADDADRQWRHKAAMAGGGALPDIGLYLVNGACFLVGTKPDLAWAMIHNPVGDPRFAEVEETVAFSLRFPGGVMAQCLTSYAAREDKHVRLHFERATVEVANAYAYRGQRMTIVSREGDHTSRNEVVLGEANQFADEIDHFACCIAENREFDTPGGMGERDHRIMAAIYESAATGRPVAI